MSGRLDWSYIILGVGIGATIGAVAAMRVKMTAMPEMVGLFNGFGGAASVLVAGSALIATFTAIVGFAQPHGAAGRADLRVMGDDRLLFEHLDARGDQDPIPLRLSVEGVRTLSLEVDFGRGQDVGDRVVWADPRLIRTAMPSPATAR